MSRIAQPSSGKPEPSRDRFLLIVRAGDASLHPAWLDPAGGPRNWDMVISHFGSETEPPENLPPGVAWTAGHGKPKWAGVADALAASPRPIEEYDYIGVGDDDIVVEAGAWSRAFVTARDNNLPACQLSLFHDSFFGHPNSLRLPGLLLHYVSRIEPIAGVIRADVFRRLLPFMDKPGNVWALDHCLVHVAGDERRRLAVLDNASILHTRRFWSGPLYPRFRNDLRLLLEDERAFLAENDVPYVEQRCSGGVTTDGRKTRTISWRRAAVVRARLLRKYREFAGVNRLAAAKNGKLWLLRKFAGVKLGQVDATQIDPVDRGRSSAELVAALLRPGRRATAAPETSTTPRTDPSRG